MKITMAAPICLIACMKLVEQPRSLIQVGFVAGDISNGGSELPLESIVFLVCGSISSLDFLEKYSQP